MKAQLFTAFRALLCDRLAALRSTGGDARAGTRVDGGHRPANRGERAAVTSQGYLAHGLSQRIEALEAAVDLLDRVPHGPRQRVVPGALVTVIDEHDQRSRFVVLPGGQGDIIESVMVLSPDAPLVRAVFGAEVGEVGVVSRRGEPVEIEVLEVG